MFRLIFLLLFCCCHSIKAPECDTFQIVNLILNDKIFNIALCAQYYDERIETELPPDMQGPPNYPFDTMPCYRRMEAQDRIYDNDLQKCIVVESGIDLKKIKYLNMVESTYQKAQFYLGSMEETESMKIDLAKLDVARSGLSVINSDEKCDKYLTLNYIFSSVYFSKSKDKAVVFLSFFSEGLAVENLAYFLQKRGEIWYPTFLEIMLSESK